MIGNFKKIFFFSIGCEANFTITSVRSFDSFTNAKRFAMSNLNARNAKSGDALRCSLFVLISVCFVYDRVTNICICARFFFSLFAAPLLILDIIIFCISCDCFCGGGGCCCYRINNCSYNTQDKAPKKITATSFTTHNQQIRSESTFLLVNGDIY